MPRLAQARTEPFVSILFTLSRKSLEATYHEQWSYDPIHYQTEEDLDPEGFLEKCPM